MGVLSVEQMELKRLKRENAELKKYLHNVATIVAQSIATLDVAMKGPTTPERGKTIAAVCNTLEYANDSMIVFGLKIDHRQMAKVKKRWTGIKANLNGQNPLRTSEATDAKA